MGGLRIVCVFKKGPGDHCHIDGVGTGTDPGARPTKVYTVEKARELLAEDPEAFYTQGLRSGQVAKVEPFTCPENHKSIRTLRTARDTVTDNDLDHLPTCPADSPAPTFFRQGTR